MNDKPQRATTDFAILGVLAQGGPMSGYDVRAYLEASVARFWSESFGQIYPALERLVRAGWISRRIDKGSSRNRRVYRVTTSGRRALQNWLKLPPADERPRSEMILKAMLGDQSDPSVTIGHLREYAERHDGIARSLEAIEAEVRVQDAGSRSLPYGIAAIRAGIHINRARAVWARESITLIESAGRNS